MTTPELKNKLIGKINQITDDEILSEVIKLLENSFEDTDIYQLSDNHKNAIRQAKEQIKSGEYLTNEQANKEIEEWLNK
jgi:predicted MPP superfamily phosphohydrolase